MPEGQVTLEFLFSHEFMCRSASSQINYITLPAPDSPTAVIDAAGSIRFVCLASSITNDDTAAAVDAIASYVSLGVGSVEVEVKVDGSSCYGSSGKRS